MLFAASWETSAFRTGTGDLVGRGQTMLDVRKSAGDPVETRVLSYGISVGDKVGVSREVWTYRGSDGIYAVFFVGDRVERIEVTPNR
jgi:hypothetical protein